MNNIRAVKSSPPRFLLVEEGAAHGLEFLYLFAENVFGETEMISEAGKTEEFCGAAVDQFPSEGCFIL